MRFLPIGGVVLLALALPWAGTSPAKTAEPAQEKLVDRVRDAIARGVQWMRDQEAGRGHWENDGGGVVRPDGKTCLAMLALLNAGVPVDDPAIQRGLQHIRKIEPRQTYVVGLQTMVFALAGQEADRERIQRNVNWLVRTRLPNGWSYGDIGGPADNSNSQYALLGLHEGLMAGAVLDPTADPKILERVRNFYIDNQKGGGWGYRVKMAPTMTMTTAGLCNLIISGLDLAAGKQVLHEDGSADRCGEYEENEPVARALAWIGAGFPDHLFEVRDFGGRSIVDLGPGTFTYPFYCLYGIERTGRLTGQRFLGGHDWYRIGCEYLVEIQKPNGSWQGATGGPGLDSTPVVATSFALLFLSKGRTPVLISKLAHGPGDDWNNKRSDARHLVEFTSRELFKRQPLAWQVFDVRRKPAENEEERHKLAAELLQAPIVYFNGHQRAPRDKEEDLLKEYLANGGFVMAEACCGRAEFDRDFRALMKRLYPDTPLTPLPPEHPVWTASGKFAVRPDLFKLEGIQQGCKTVVIYSPQPLAGYWEAWDPRKKEQGRMRTALELGANIIAYATGLEPPKPRLTEVEVFRGDAQRDPVRRGFLKVVQLRHEGDWQPAPQAMRHLMDEARKAGLDVVLETKALSPASENLLDYRFFYMHGRNAFQFRAEDLKSLRFSLQAGGTLLADACCGARQFDESFRKFMEVLWAPEKLRLEPIPPGDELYGKELNGEAITRVRCRRERPEGAGAAELRLVPPALEGIKYKGRWVVIYSRYDLGCALEKHQSPDCLGHDYESAVRLGKAAVLYALMR